MMNEEERYIADLNHRSHDIYTDADKDKPDAICDINGQVVLGLCKRCCAAEYELGLMSCDQWIVYHYELKEKTKANK